MLMQLDLIDKTEELLPVNDADHRLDSKKGNEITPKHVSTPRTNQENLTQSKKSFDPLHINEKEKEL